MAAWAHLPLCGLANAGAAGRSARTSGARQHLGQMVTPGLLGRLDLVFPIFPRPPNCAARVHRQTGRNAETHHGPRGMPEFLDRRCSLTPLIFPHFLAPSIDSGLDTTRLPIAEAASPTSASEPSGDPR